MYFSNRNITAYQGVVSAIDLQELLKRKATIAVFDSHGKYQIPDYIKENPDKVPKGMNVDSKYTVVVRRS
jgi:hypothetical protein